jgi:hypothetical protein
MNEIIQPIRLNGYDEPELELTQNLSYATHTSIYIRPLSEFPIMEPEVN